VQLDFFLLKLTDLTLQTIWHVFCHRSNLPLCSCFNVHNSDFELTNLGSQLDNLLLQAIFLKRTDLLILTVHALVKCSCGIERVSPIIGSINLLLWLLLRNDVPIAGAVVKV
jgi:hypothetical protein